MAGADAITANVLPVAFPFESFRAWKRPVRDGEDLAGLRQSLAGQWAVYWEGGELYLLPLTEEIRQLPETEPVECMAGESLRLLARLVTEALQRRFPGYEPLRTKPFTILGQRMELMQDAGKVLGLDHPLLPGFRIRPKYSLDGRLMEIRPDEPFVAITANLTTRWEITAGLEALAAAGADLGGLYVVRPEQEAGRRRLVGRIGSIGSGRVELSESTDSESSVAVADVMLEGRREAFARCLRPLLGADYPRYDAYRDKRMGELLGGRPFLEEITRVARVLADQPLDLANSLSCTVAEPLRPANKPGYKSIVTARRLDYCFDPARSKRHRYAWPGLEQYGPFSRDTFPRPSPRILVVFPQAVKGAVETFVRYLRDGVPRTQGFHAGMAKTFGLLNPRFDLAPVPGGAVRTAAEAYRRTISDALAGDDLPDAAIVIVTDQDGDLPDTQNPYLHSKAMLLMAGVAAQEAPQHDHPPAL